MSVSTNCVKPWCCKKKKKNNNNKKKQKKWRELEDGSKHAWSVIDWNQAMRMHRGMALA